MNVSTHTAHHTYVMVAYVCPCSGLNTSHTVAHSPTPWVSTMKNLLSPGVQGSYTSLVDAGGLPLFYEARKRPFTSLVEPIWLYEPRIGVRGSYTRRGS